MKCHVWYAVTIKGVVILFSESRMHSEECPIGLLRFDGFCLKNESLLPDICASFPPVGFGL